ncbi:hypothetical protein ICV00_04720 [Polynucleobacter asymbioticus]|nr:hypothetical protein ICV00_04720 [Polynucleobacter asymbioticus]
MKNIRLIPYLLIPLLIFLGTMFRSTYHLDAHHWGLMLSNSKDLYEGKLPYKEIFIQYGFLTTFIQATGYALSKNLLTLIGSSTIAYILGLIILFELSVKAIKNDLIALYVVVIAYLLHPIVIYPWSNYIAFPFLMCGVYVLVYPQSRLLNLLGGICLGLSILAREGLAPAVTLAMLSSFVLDFYNNQGTLKQYITQSAIILVGFLVPIVLFFFYISSLGLFLFWEIMAIDLPRVYATQIFIHMSGLYFLRNLVVTCLRSVISLDFRWILITLIFITNTYFLCRFLFKNRPHYLKIEIIKISFFSLILASSAIHLSEIFRISTASVIGLISLFTFLHFYKLANKIFIIFFITLTLTIVWRNSGIYYFPSLDNIRMAKKVEISEYFVGQRWPVDRINYYKRVNEEFKKINTLNTCQIKYLINNTIDSFIPLLSPFKPLQQAPFVLRESMSNLRPDFVKLQNSKFDEAADVVIVEGMPKDPESQILNFENYRLHAVISTSDKIELRFYIPSKCFHNNN